MGLLSRVTSEFTDGILTAGEWHPSSPVVCPPWKVTAVSPEREESENGGLGRSSLSVTSNKPQFLSSFSALWNLKPNLGHLGHLGQSQLP